MITCVNINNLQEYGFLYSGQFKLRHQEFIARQAYNAKTYLGMEYDQYDSPAACYLVSHDRFGRVFGTSRLAPTIQGCMLKDLWPECVHEKSLLSHPLVWEGTRYCVDRNIPVSERRCVINEMAVAYLEFGLALGIKKIIGIMQTYIYRSVFENPGIKMEYLGDIKIMDGQKTRAVAIPVEQEQLNNVRLKTGIHGQILNPSILFPPVPVTPEPVNEKAA